MELFYRRGLWLESDGEKILFDPTAKMALEKADHILVTHGHTDHASAFRNASGESILSSNITREVIEARYGVELGDHDFDAKTFNAGHVMGSRQFMVGNVLYTGDINTARQVSVEPAETPSAETLIVEATYGSPENVLPPHQKVVEEIDAFVQEAFARDRPAVFYAYSLGKAQELAALLQKYPLFVDEEIHTMNDIYSRNVRKLGCHLLPEGMSLDRNDFVAIFTARKMRQNKFLLGKGWETNDPMTAAATGWAMVDWFKEGVARKLQLDGVFPLSSHADFNGLCDFVEAVSPKKVYTLYGSTRELAAELKKRGYDAEPVRSVRGRERSEEKCRAC